MVRGRMLVAELGALGFMLALAAAPAHAAAPHGSVPSWLWGEWAVAQVYQLEDADFDSGSGVPKRWLPGKTMVVTRDRRVGGTGRSGLSSDMRGAFPCS